MTRRKRINGYYVMTEDNQVGIGLKFAHKGDAGLDLYANEKVDIPPGGRQLVGTGICVAVPKKHVGLLFARSGIAVKYGLIVGAGVIDSGYRGEVKVLLFNCGQEHVQLPVGYRIAQLVTLPIHAYPYRLVTQLYDTERGANGFGSTDKADKREGKNAGEKGKVA